MARRQSIPIVRPISDNLHTCSCNLETLEFSPRLHFICFLFPLYHAAKYYSLAVD